MDHDSDGTSPEGKDQRRTDSARGEQGRVPDRRRQPDGPPGKRHLQGVPDSGTYEEAEDAEPDNRGYDTPDVDNDPYLLALIEARVQAELHQHQHIHLPAQSEVEQMVELRTRAPEAYHLWIETTRSQHAHEIWASKKTIRQPYLLANFGQACGLVAVFGAFGVAGYALYQGSGVVAGILGVVNVIGLAAVFNGNNRKISTESPGDEQ